MVQRVSFYLVVLVLGFLPRVSGQQSSPVAFSLSDYLSSGYDSSQRGNYAPLSSRPLTENKQNKKKMKNIKYIQESIEDINRNGDKETKLT